MKLYTKTFLAAQAQAYPFHSFLASIVSESDKNNFYLVSSIFTSVIYATRPIQKNQTLASDKCDLKRKGNALRS